MSTNENHGRSVEVDDAGFLVHIDDWNEEVACALAKKLSIYHVFRGSTSPQMPDKWGS